MGLKRSIVQSEIEKNEPETAWKKEKPKNEQPKAGKPEVERSKVKIRKGFCPLSYRKAHAQPSNKTSSSLFLCYFLFIIFLDLLP